MRRILTMLTMLMLFGVVASAQTRVVTGKVMDDAGRGIFASVKVQNSGTGTSTESDGSFSIRVSNNSILEFSATGYEATTVPVGTQTYIVASLKTDQANSNLTEVVVSSVLGQVRQKSTLGVATTTIRSTELTQGRSTNLSQGLVGKVSGASFQQTNSGVGQDTRIVLRGIRSLTGNNQPMLVLDGVPISLGYLSSINPNDIADVTILKSATAAGVYGPDAVNGAIIVTTKKGSKMKPQISVSHSTQFESISYMPKFQTRWGSGYDQDAATGQGTYTAYEQQSWGDEFDGSIRDLGEASPGGFTRQQKYSYIPGERKRFFDVGTTNQTDVSYSTGDFYLSGQNVSTKGTMPGDELTRRTATLRSEKEYNRFKAILNVRYTQTKLDRTTANTTVYYGVTSAPGNVPLSQYSNWRNDYFSSPDGYYTTYLTNFDLTPYFAKDNNRQTNKTDDIFGNAEFNFKASSWLSFVYRVGLSISTDDAHATRGAFTSSDFYVTRASGPSRKIIASAVTDANNYSSRITSETFANFNKSFKDIQIDGTVGHSFRHSRTKFVSAGSNNLGQSAFLSIANRLGEPTVGVDNSEAKLERFFGRVSFNYKKWLNIEGTASYDRDSRLVPANKIFQNQQVSFFYPGVNASLLMHEIIPSLKSGPLNFFKVRGGIAKTGNVNAPIYANETAFGSATFFPYGTTPGYLIGTTVYPVQGIKPEFVYTKEAGVELGFLKNKINLEVNYYHQRNTDQILNVQLSNTTGATTAVLNAGEFTNSGVEVDLALNRLVKFGDFNVDLKVNYAYQQNKITKLIDNVNELGIGNYNFAVVGSPVFVFKATDYVRDSATGKVIVDRATGMPSLNSTETVLGKTLPDHIVGLNLNLSWKALTLSIGAQYSTGNQIIADQLGQFMDDNGISERSGSFGRRAFVFPNSVVDDGTGKLIPNTNVYTQSFGRLFYNTDLNTGAISNYVASGAFWKLREVALTYTFPSSVFKGNGLKGVVVGISGRNLLMWLPKSNQWTDPEFTANGNSGYTGNATGRSTAFNMPPTRFIGANVTFQF